ncbi:putative bifunctional diguanylate cyclase/phosphodiesterase [Sphingomonas sp. GlSt437]|uniref:putative bifunctional diguanylate cyclase/phosphodiesterase n=1 Tax=Sphingomonas sp. GlSt437 TaxID=3389970 RepID=UPI003A878F18
MKLGFWEALGLTAPDVRHDWVDRRGQVRQVAATVIATLLVQIAASVVLSCAAILSESLPTILWVASAAAAALVGAGLLAIVLLVPPMRRWPPHQHVRLITVLGALQAAGLSGMLWAATQLAPGTQQLAGFIAALAAMAATGMSIHPIRAALIAFAAVVVASVFMFAGINVASLIAFGCWVCLVISARRLVMLDCEAALRQARIADDGRLAAQLVREFESHGTGWFWQTDKDGNISYLSSKVAEVLTVDGQSPMGQSLTSLFRMDNATAGTERTLSFHLSSRTAFSDYSVRAAAPRLHDRWWSISGRPVTDALGRFQGFVGSGSDLTEKRRADAEITRLALFDSLTGLANRQRMRLSLDQSLNQPGGMRRPTALFLLDLDRFKVVNDTMGHQMGDALLKQVAQRLLRSVGDNGLVGRLGGDEFEIILPGENSADRLSELARTIIAALSQAYLLDGTSVTIGCSIGIAIAPNDGDDSETLVRNADLALYAAKADGRGVHRFYRAELLHGAQSRKQLEDDLREALVGQQFHLVYQPVVCTRDETIVGYEALLRWEHPVRGAISPAEFVPIAEDCGLIEAIGEWVLRTACLDAASWPGNVRVGVNVSPIQFANPGLPALVTSALAKAGIAANRLELEITEGVFLEGGNQTDQMFRALKGLGIRLALDDFGTGYSSLGYLKSAPFDKIKIDQSFVRGAAIGGNRNAPIIRAIVTLADTLGMETTAEGAEAQDEIELIRELGCSHIQGFVYGRPIRSVDVVRQLVEQQGRATASGFRVSRGPRAATIRWAMIDVGGVQGEVRIRNLSSQGAMIDGIEFGGPAEGTPISIELIEGEMVPARVRWASDGRAGIEFFEAFNIERLAQPGASMQPHLRKAG